MRSCSVCLHAHRSQIEADLMGGAKLIPTAQRYGLSKSAVARHREGCLAPKVAAAAAMVQPHAPATAAKKRHKAIAAGKATPTTEEALDLAGLLGRMARSLERLDDAAEKAVKENAVGALTAASAQLHRGIELFAKLAGLGVQPVDEPANRAAIIFNFGPGSAPTIAAVRTIEGAGGARNDPHEEPPFKITIEGAGVGGHDADEEEPTDETDYLTEPLRVAGPLRRPDLAASGLSKPSQEAVVRDLAMPDFNVAGNRNFNR